MKVTREKNSHMLFKKFKLSLLWVVINKVISRNSKLTFFNSVQSRAGPIVGLERFLTVRKAGRCLVGPTQDIDTDAKQDTLVKIGSSDLTAFVSQLQNVLMAI